MASLTQHTRVQLWGYEVISWTRKKESQMPNSAESPSSLRPPLFSTDFFFSSFIYISFTFSFSFMFRSC